MNTSRLTAHQPRLLVLAEVSLAAAALLTMSMPTLAHADTLNRQLETGMSGSDVSSLQTFLAATPAYYPQALVTGYFGFLTKSAVANFQSANGLPSVGRVGPATLPVINAQMANGTTGTDKTGAWISGVNVNTSSNSATISWNTNEATKGSVYYSSSVLSEYELPTSVQIGGSVASNDNNLHNSQSVVLSGLSANTTYYYDVYVTDSDGNVSMTQQATFRTSN